MTPALHTASQTFIGQTGHHPLNVKPFCPNRKELSQERHLNVIVLQLQQNTWH
jgi:hypothetical protein